MPPDLGRIQPEPGSRHVQQPLAREVALRAAGRAERADGRLVRHDAPEVARVGRHTVRPGQERGAELRGHEGRGPHVCADVGVDHRPHGHDPSGGVEAELEIVLHLARVVRRDEVLAALLDPADGPAELQRGERDEDVLGIELAPGAEAAAHVHLGEAQRAGRDSEDRREDGAVDVDALGRADEVELAAARVGRHRDEPARLEGGRRLPRVAEALADDEVRTGQRRAGVADPHPDRRDVVRVRPGKEARRVGRERDGDGRARRERRVVDVDQLERVRGEVAVVGHDERHGLADVADDVARDRGLQVAGRALGRGHPVGDDGARRHVRGGEDGAHPRQPERARGVHAADARVRVGRSEHRRLEHARRPDVGDEPAVAGRETLAAEAAVAGSDHRAPHDTLRPV